MSKSLFDYLSDISFVTSRTEKLGFMIDLLNDHPELSRLAFGVALDPQISTFITKRPIVPEATSVQGAPASLTSILSLLTSGTRFSKAEWAHYAACLDQDYDEWQQQWIWQILTKDLTIGASISTFNKAAKLCDHDVPVIVEYDTVRVSNIEDADIDYSAGAFAGVKYDGANATFSRRLISRNGKPIPLAHIEEPLARWDHITLFGELVSTDRQSSSGLVNSAIKKGLDTDRDVHKLRLHVFDAMPTTEYDAIYSGELKECRQPFHERILMAKEVVERLDCPHIQFVEQIEVNSEDEFKAFAASVIEQGHEGAIVNDRFMRFAITRTTKRARIKEIHDGDFEIVDFNEHSKKPGHLGSFVFKTRGGDLVCNTGSGLSDEQRKFFWEHREETRGKILKVKYNRVIPSSDDPDKFTLFLPVLDTNDLIRHDKQVADSLAEIQWGNNDRDKKKWLGAQK